MEFGCDPVDEYLQFNFDPVVNQPRINHSPTMSQPQPMKPTSEVIQEMFGFIFKDDFIEDALLKAPELFNKFIEDNRVASEKKMSAMLTDEELKKYESLYPGLKNSTRKRKILSFLKLNPAFATVHPEILWQRINFYQMNYGNASNSVSPVPERPMHDVIEKTVN